MLMKTSHLAALALLAAFAGGASAQSRDTMALAATPKGALSFLAMGDWGMGGERRQRDVAQQMGRVADTMGAQFVLVLGDNFYPNGVQSVQDPQWKSSFEDVYTAFSLNVDWYVALGNHDYRGRPQAQLEYSNVSRRWRLPSRYYRVTRTIAPGVTADFLIIDTTPFMAEYRKDPGKYALAGTDTAAQRRWIGKTLAASTAKWKFIVGHHNVYSGGKRTSEPDMERLLVPLMKKYGVAAYICGHEHHLEHIVPDGTALNFFISGGGAEGHPAGGTAGTRFVSSEAGFLAFSLSVDSLLVQAVDYRGRLLYRSALRR